jgi:hypothetical protein
MAGWLVAVPMEPLGRKRELKADFVTAKEVAYESSIAHDVGSIQSLMLVRP